MTLCIKHAKKTVLKMKYGRQLVVFVPLTITELMGSAKAAQETQFMSPALKLAGILAQTDKFGS